MTPRFSIITVCFNAEQSIGKTVESMAAQTFRDFEYIVVDGASRDNTLDVARSHLTFPATIMSEKDHGIYDAMNKGIACAQGEIVYFLNADDYFENDSVLERIADAFATNGEPQLLFGNVIYQYPEGQKHRSFRHITPGNLVFLDVNHQATFAKRSLFNQMGSFDLRFRLNADYDFLLRCLHGKASYCWVDVDIARFNAGGRHVQDVAFLQTERKAVRRQYVSPLGYKVGTLAHKLSHKIRRAAGMLGLREQV
ncbi:MAG: glycosyl transferase [Candidatus Accumulibacter phosphatis]|uniref:Glycosyl transferase n=1 Tax=Candidatus Accumulibacter phosphatis TaxID=327160 RepID=A0A6A7RWA4_9PROT|nr:glycosyl transferase [Candidatus Accumulibacter phosphatis]